MISLKISLETSNLLFNLNFIISFLLLIKVILFVSLLKPAPLSFKELSTTASKFLLFNFFFALSISLSDSRAKPINN